MQLVAEPKNIKMENCGIRTICSHPQGKLEFMPRKIFGLD